MITDDFFASLDIMWKGMAGLFVVSIFIMLVVIAIKFFMRKKKPSANDQQGAV